MGFIGAGRAYKSASALSLAAGLDKSTVNGILTRGRSDPDTLHKLARALQVPTTEPFIHAGWLDPADLHPNLRQDQIELLDRYERIPVEKRRVLLEVADAMRA
jgi:hypothetical protein